MAGDIYLNGSEDVKRAGHAMSEAAASMQSAASSMHESMRFMCEELQRHAQFLHEYMVQMEAVIKAMPPTPDAPELEGVLDAHGFYWRASGTPENGRSCLFVVQGQVQKRDGLYNAELGVFSTGSGDRYQFLAVDRWAYMNGAKPEDPPVHKVGDDLVWHFGLDRPIHGRWCLFLVRGTIATQRRTYNSDVDGFDLPGNEGHSFFGFDVVERWAYAPGSSEETPVPLPASVEEGYVWRTDDVHPVHGGWCAFKMGGHGIRWGTYNRGIEAFHLAGPGDMCTPFQDVDVWAYAEVASKKGESEWHPTEEATPEHGKWCVFKLKSNTARDGRQWGDYNHRDGMFELESGGKRIHISHVGQWAYAHRGARDTL